MIRYFKLYKSFIKNCLVREMEFRLNFIIQTIIYLLWAGMAYASIFLIYNQVDLIGSWDRNRMLLLTSVFGFTNAIFGATLQRNINKLPRYIRSGDLDFMLSKPLNTKFLVSTRYFTFTHTFRLIVYLYLTYKLTFIINPNLTFTQMLIGLFLIITGLLGMYSFLFMINCIAFWKPRVWNLFAIVNQMKNLADRPSDIFRGFLRLLVNSLPIAAFATIPTKFLLGEGSVNLFFVAIAASLTFFLLSQFIWNQGLKQYESASS